jgi:hypothetical protein
MRSTTLVGPIVLILIGAISLLQNFGWFEPYDWADSKWSPVWLIILGVAIALRRLLRPPPSS